MAILTLWPDGVGASNAFSRVGTDLTANWQAVDDTPSDDDTTYIYISSDTARIDMYAIPDHGAEAGTINSVTVKMMAKKTGSAVSFSAFQGLGVGTTNYFKSSTVTLTTAYAVYANTWALNPSGSVAWDWTAIDALQIGAKASMFFSTGGNVRITQIWVEIDYTPSGGGGTEYTKAVSGGLGLAGVLGLGPRKIVAGGLGSSGSVTRFSGRGLTGSLTTAGSLARFSGRGLDGSLTLDGGLYKRAGRTVTGGLSMAGSLSAIKAILKTLAGILSISGTTAHLPRKVVSGVLASAGTVARRTTRSLASSLSTNGILTSIRTRLKLLTGSLSTAGSVSRQTRRQISSTLSSSGTVLKRAARRLVGTLSMSGLLNGARGVLRVLLSGSMSLSSTVQRGITRSIAGTLAPQGSRTRLVMRNLVGQIELIGSVTGLFVIITQVVGRIVRRRRQTFTAFDIYGGGDAARAYDQLRGKRRR